MASQLQVRDKSAWMGRDFRDDDSWIVTLTKSQVAELSDAAIDGAFVWHSASNNL